MKKIFMTLCAIALGAVAANAQITQEQIDTLSMNAQAVAKDAYVEFPYSKVMFATRTELSSQKFKYDDYYNQMKLQHVNGLMAVLNVMSETYTPAKNDYRIIIQYGANDAISYVQVVFYDKDIYDHIMLFAADKECPVKEVANGKGMTYSFNYGGYDFTMEFTHVDQHISSTNTGTTKNGRYSHSTTSTQDLSYDQYVYTVYTGCAAVSEYLDKQAAKKAKRAMKGRKSKSSGDFL